MAAVGSSSNGDSRDHIVPSRKEGRAMKRLSFGAGIFTILVYTVPLSAKAQAQGSPHRSMPYPQISVAPVVIEARTPADAVPRADTESLRLRLAQEARSALERSVRKRHIALQTQHRDKAQSDMPHLTAIVSLPLSLPSGVSGLRANDRKGVFATVLIQLQDVEGRTLAKATAQLEWDDGDWLTGAPKVRRRRPLDDVLRDFTRKGVAQAAFHLATSANRTGTAAKATDPTKTDAKDSFNDSLQ
jgi:hypothetical protein